MFACCLTCKRCPKTLSPLLLKKETFRRKISSIRKIATKYGDLKIQESFTVPPGSGGTASVSDTTGRSVWPTAKPLLDHILANYSGGNVLELGAGCGVVGMGLAAATAASQRKDNPAASGHSFHVLSTDQNVDWLERNISMNRDIVGDHEKNIQVAKLAWGERNDMENVKQLLGEAPLDLIVGSDILYHHQSHSDLVETLRFMATSNHTSIVLAYPGRQGDGDSFARCCQKTHYFDMKVYPMTSQVSSGSSGKSEYFRAELVFQDDDDDDHARHSL